MTEIAYYRNAPGRCAVLRTCADLYGQNLLDSSNLVTIAGNSGVSIVTVRNAINGYGPEYDSARGEGEKYNGMLCMKSPPRVANFSFDPLECKSDCSNYTDCPLKVAIEGRRTSEKNDSSVLRFVRAADLGYLRLVLGETEGEFEAFRIMEMYHFNERNEEYLNAARKATSYLTKAFQSGIEDIYEFYEVFDKYGYFSAYGDLKRVMRSDYNSRGLLIPTRISNSLNKLFPPSESTNNFNEWDFFTPINKVIKRVYGNTKTILDGENSFAIRLSLAIHSLYIMERTYTWFNGNHSRCMNYFNVLLEKIGLEPIPHGVIDFAAHLFDFERFEKYMHYVIDLEH